MNVKDLCRLESYGDCKWLNRLGLLSTCNVGVNRTVLFGKSVSSVVNMLFGNGL